MGEMHILTFCNTALAFYGRRVGKFKTDYCVASFQTLVFDLIWFIAAHFEWAEMSGGEKRDLLQ